MSVAKARALGAPVSLQEELDRVIPVVERLRQEVGCPLSVDTCKSECRPSR
jgi:dihydropteroate synthase